jgi:hypothetical protein
MSEVKSNQETANNDNEVLATVLFVGAKLYRVHYKEITEVLIIEKITKTQATSKNSKFRLELRSDGSAIKVGDTDKWSSANYYIETEQLKETLLKQKAVCKLSKYNFAQLDIVQLNAVLALLNCS